MVGWTPVHLHLDVAPPSLPLRTLQRRVRVSSPAAGPEGHSVQHPRDEYEPDRCLRPSLRLVRWTRHRHLPFQPPPVRTVRVRRTQTRTGTRERENAGTRVAISARSVIARRRMRRGNPFGCHCEGRSPVAISLNAGYRLAALATTTWEPRRSAAGTARALMSGVN